ncbi:S-layer homology domain-containing protein [Crassaminicella profunda]|uniref:S-layer homology domain-containing protein n=1 Tax=Crassaminicella profunda TaxID=1286698 RepID=UPI001CA77A6D|nr:S-layer homology domain-containing protein [Crassaminicella profunda]QZY56977.1 S-layer homology domain-containing protein [Crassaminicella profunda]
MKKIFLFCMIFLTIWTIPSIGVSQRNDDKDVKKAYEDGQKFGAVAGELSGKKDLVNNRKNNWEKAFREEEKNLYDEYDLDDETGTYRINFKKGFEEAFEKEYERGYRNSETSLDSEKSAEEIGLENGKFFGAMLGESHGRKDFYAGKTNDYRRNMPSDEIIRKEYSLSKDSKEYSDNFVLGYKKAYEEKYTYVFRVSNVDNKKITKEDGLDNGKEIGEKMGKAYGNIDYEENKVNNWRHAILSDLEIMHKYNLLKEVPEYRTGFIAGFKDGFKIGYTDAFQQANMNIAKGNVNYVKVSMQGEIIVSDDQNVTLSIEAGTFYRETFFSLAKINLPSNYPHESYEAVTNMYEIKVENNLSFINTKKPMILQFKYYGSETGGIYKLVNNEWLYLNSVIDKNTISTKIPATHYSGGIYAVFIDDHYTELTDVHSNWAGEEIYSFMRRNYVSGYPNNTFRPENHVSRAEFVTLLGRVNKWNSSITNLKQKEFNDAESFGVFKNDIINAVGRGYIQGYPDNTFRPNKSISYQEIEWIIQKIPGNETFKWDDIAEKMFYEKYTRSKSRFGKNKCITRAEVVYMLYVLQQEKRL